MASIIKPKRSSTPGSFPSAGALEQGEIAINLADRKIFVKDHTDAVVEVPIPGGGGGASAFSPAEVNLGSTARKSGKFTISGSGLTTGRPVLIFQAAGPYSGKGTRADEAEMDNVAVSASVTSSTQITCYWNSATRVRGNRKFNYLIGA